MKNAKQEYIRMKKVDDFKKLEKAANKIYLGASNLDNDVKLETQLFSDPDKWEYIIKLHISINGVKRKLHKRVSMDDVDSPERLRDYVREMCIKDLAKYLTSKFFQQNLKTINELYGTPVV